MIGQGAITYCYDHITSNSLILPHKLLLLGTAWKKNVKMSNVSQIITGDYRHKLASELPESSSSLDFDYYIISQPTIHVQIVSIIEYFKDLKWCVCLHPIDRSNLQFIELLDSMRVNYAYGWKDVLHSQAEIVGSSSMLLLELLGKVKSVTQIIDTKAKYIGLGIVSGFDQLIEKENSWEFVKTNTSESVTYFEELSYEELRKVYSS